MSWLNIFKYVIVFAELTAAIAWLLKFNRLQELRLKILALFLGYLTFTELLNLFSSSPDSLINQIIIKLNTVLEIGFWIYFLTSKLHYTRWGLLCLIVVIYVLEQATHVLAIPSNFYSFTEGIGSLAILGLLITNMFHFFQHKQFAQQDYTWLLLLLIGVMLFYIGSFPYHNFRNFFWNNKSYYNLAYILYYTTQIFCISMYLIFAYTAIWKVK